MFRIGFPGASGAWSVSLPTSRFANVLFANVLGRFAYMLNQFPN